MHKLIPFAFDERGHLIHVSQAKANGLACDCTCPCCGCRLVAKREGQRKQPHFAHCRQAECEGARETVLHLLAKEVVVEEKCLMLPSYRYLRGPQQQRFIEVRTEERLHRSDLQPDAEGLTAGGEVVLIEFKVTHAVDEAKAEKIRQSGLKCVEIDLNGVDMDKEAVRSFLVDADGGRWWICNPELDALWQEECQRREEERQKEEERKKAEAERERLEQQQRKLEREKSSIIEYREQHPECKCFYQSRCKNCRYHSLMLAWWSNMEAIRPYMPEWGLFYLKKNPQEIVDEQFFITPKPSYVLDESGNRRYIYPKTMTDDQKKRSDRLYRFFNNLFADAGHIVRGFWCDDMKKTFNYDGKSVVACSNRQAWPKD